MAEYTYKHWENEQNEENNIHADDCYRWQAGIEAAGGTWDGTWTDNVDTAQGHISADQLNALETEIASLYGSGFTAKTFADGNIPGVDEWNRIEDAINTILNRTAFAIYCETDNSLTFYVDTEVPAVGDTYGGKAVTAVYTGLENTNWSSASEQPWDSVRDDIQSVVIDKTFNLCKPKSLQRWFMSFNVPISGLDYIDTSEVTNLGYAFYGCTSLTSIDALANWDVSKVTNLGYAFYGCTSLTSIDALANWDVSKVTSLLATFYGCTSLTSIDALTNWDTSAVTTLQSCFCGLTVTSINLSGWNTANVTTMFNCFYNNRSVKTFDLTGWDTKSATNLRQMFYSNISLKTIYASEGQFDISNVTSDDNMFYNCPELVGGNGTVYDSSKVDASMAHIDTAGNPGYFTAK